MGSGNVSQLLLSFSFGGILALAVTSVALYIITKTVYNVFFHPLRRYPGPFWYKATRIPYLWTYVSGRLSIDIQKMHEEYGEVVRVAPDELSYTNPDAWKDIYGHRPQGQPEMAKWDKFYNPNKSGTQDIITADRDGHGRLRRLLSHGFSDKSMRDQEPLIKQYLDLLIDRLHENCAGGSKALDMVLWYNWTTFDIIGDLAFGEPFGCLLRSDYHPWVAMIFSMVKAGTVFQAASHFPLIKKLLVCMIPKSVLAKREAHIKLTREKILRRQATEKERPDFFGAILKKQSEFNMTLPELEANGNILIIGGSETTATLLSGVTYFLLTNPHAMRKLVHEVRSTFKSEDEISINSVSKLPYMLACLDEALRMFPPTPVGLPRVVPKGGDVVNGRFVPGNTIVSVNQWAINHDPSNWHKPWEYVPERFLGDERFAAERKDAMQPFSVGPRNCLGRNLAYAEMRLIVARVTFNFDMTISDDSRDWISKQKIYAMWEKSPLMVHLTPRENK